MEKHTPGPWKCQHSEATTVRDAHGGAICQLKFLKGEHGLGGRRDTNEVEANARLIAAAPDLYDAIRNSDDVHWTPAMRAALAKAEGADITSSGST